MKAYLIMLMFCLALFSVAACKKDKTPGKDIPEKTTQEKIMGKWDYVSRSVETVKPPDPPKITTTPGKPGDHFDFRTATMFYYVVNGEEDNEAYSINSNNELLINNDVYTITELTDKKFVFSTSLEEDGELIKVIYTLSR